MGDLLRRLLYPLFVPAIVAAVWAHAWSLKLEDEQVRSGPLLPAPLPTPRPPPEQRPPAAGYGLSRGDDAFASTDFDEEQ